MLINVIKSYRDVVAVCDSNLIGKIFEEEKLQLDVKESFYKGEEKSKEEVKDILQKMALEDATFNIVGNESVETALEAGIITQDLIGEIQGVPFALVLL